MESYWDRTDDDVFLDAPIVYSIPAGPGPSSRFVKSQMTEDELEAAFEHSPLNDTSSRPWWARWTAHRWS